MNKKSAAILIAMSSLLAFAAAADGIPAPGNKLGYGFAPGLQARKDFVEGEVIVGLADRGKKDAVVQAAQAMGGMAAKSLEDGSAVLLRFGSEQAAQAAINALQLRREVLFIERNGIVKIPPQPSLDTLRSLKRNALKGPTAGPTIDSVSGDPGTGFQWHHTVIRKTAALPTLTATPPTVAVIDTGVDYTHPDLAAPGKVIKGFNAIAQNFDPYDDNGHGTHVAGLIAATAANNTYGEGVCPNCKILAVKVLGADGSGTDFDVAQGMQYVVTYHNNTSPATRVANMSLGGGNSMVIAAQVLAMKNAGIVLAAAAGNDNTEDTSSAFPGADPNTALRVMATEENDCRAWFSNFSPIGSPGQYNIAAPGWQIYSTMPNSGYAALSGTSMATPIVAGSAALVWGQLPSLTPDGLVSRLVSNGKLISCGFATSTARVDVRKAILGSSETADIGRLLDPFIGKAPSPNTSPANARLYNGGTQVGLDLTNAGGFYEMTGLTTGARDLRGDRTGYVSAKMRSLNILGSLVNGPYTDALPTARVAGNATITLDWKNSQPIDDTAGCVSTCNGWEFDLWAKLPDASYVGPYGNTGDLAASPFVKNPRDSVNDLQPLETVVVSSQAANGVYKIFVDNYFTGSPYFNDSWTGSLASVQLYNGATSIGAFYPEPPVACAFNRFWYVGNLTKNGATYTWTSVNACQNAAP